MRDRGIAPAALILDSIFSSDGVFAEPAGFIAQGVAAVRRAGGVFIADEVQPGFGRTGDAFWGFQRHGVEPDMVTMSKPMGNGFPMAGLAVRPDYLAAFCKRFGYFNTFAGNPVAAVAGHATLRIIQRDGLQENARVVGAHIKSRLEQLVLSHPRISGVRGAGLFIGIDFNAEGRPAQPDPLFAVEMVDALRRKNVLIGMAGKYAATLRVRPPLCMTLNEGDMFVEAFTEALQLM
ncbi:Diaminobutyrate--2-oxoglutarate aminotransferase [compost metagenome]